LYDPQWAKSLRDDVDDLGLALRHTPDEQHAPAVQVFAVAHDQPRRDDHVAQSLFERPPRLEVNTMSDQGFRTLLVEDNPTDVLLIH